MDTLRHNRRRGSNVVTGSLLLLESLTKWDLKMWTPGLVAARATQYGGAPVTRSSIFLTRTRNSWPSTGSPWFTLWLCSWKCQHVLNPRRSAQRPHVKWNHEGAVGVLEAHLFLWLLSTERRVVHPTISEETNNPPQNQKTTKSSYLLKSPLQDFTVPPLRTADLNCPQQDSCPETQ